MDKTQPCGGCNRGSSPRGDTILRNMKISTPITSLPGIGPAYQKKLEKLKIKTIGDLLFYFPSRYENIGKRTPISSIFRKGHFTVIGEIDKIETGRTSKKNLSYSQVSLSDSSGTIKAVWLNQPYLARTLEEGEKILLSGEVNFFNKSFQFVNPLYEKIKDAPSLENKILSFYPETKGVSSKWIRFNISRALKEVELTESLPLNLIKERDLHSLALALKEIHFPSSLLAIEGAQKRLSFERIFLLQLFLLQQKINISREKGIAIKVDIEKVQELVSSLPFELTGEQKKASWQIIKDLEKTSPMNRLLEGDVGSGKTVVAVIAILVALKSGYQAALMAPTEVLAKQHFDEVSKLLWPFKIDVGLLTGKKDKLRSTKLKGDVLEISKEKLIEKTKKGEIPLLIGTHSLIQEKVKFKNLALVVLDEQHRFGVEQRSRLCVKKDAHIPHLLSMTATPIPRTLALTVYGDLNLSLIREMPKERKKIITKLVSPSKRKDAYGFIEKEINNGRQAFFICPKIEEKEEEENKPKSAWSDLKSVEKETEILQKEVFPNFRIGALHGKMKGSEKDKVMKDFRNKKYDILVSTSVIEVGIDIKNASVIVIEGAEMFGLSQLHQFRGRVGRGEFQSYCFLFTNSNNEKTKKRLEALLQSKDGFELAEKDLELRGPGDFLGKKQWGSADFTMEALKNRFLVEEAREAAKKILQKDPELEEYPLLKNRVTVLKQKIHLE